MYVPAGSSRKDPSGDHANLRKKDGSVSSWNKWDLTVGCKVKDYIAFVQTQFPVKCSSDEGRADIP